MLKIGIIGNGFVGKATQLFACNNIKIFVYDIVPELCIPLGITLVDINKCDLIFICVPTPLDITGKCKTSIIDKLLTKIDNPHTVIRSTVPIGYSTKKDCYFMPEFLTELNWKNDFITNKDWIVGLIDKDEKTDTEFIDKIRLLITYAFEDNKIENNNIIFCKNDEAEMIKLIKNSFLANKVSFFNEMYDLANALNINYDEVTKILQLDARIGHTHMKVPGYDKKKGFGLTCLPKDLGNLHNLILEHNLKSFIVESALYRNEYHDRRERDWLNLEGRAADHTTKTIVLSNDPDYCYKLLKSTNYIVILLGSPNKKLLSFSNFYYKKYSDKIFIPRVDIIYYFINQSVYNSVKTTLSILELTKLHDAKLIINGSNNEYVYDINFGIINDFLDQNDIDVEFN